MRVELRHRWIRVGLTLLLLAVVVAAVYQLRRPSKHHRDIALFLVLAQDVALAYHTSGELSPERFREICLQSVRGELRKYYEIVPGEAPCPGERLGAVYLLRQSDQRQRVVVLSSIHDTGRLVQGTELTFVAGTQARSVVADNTIEATLLVCRRGLRWWNWGW